MRFRCVGIFFKYDIEPMSLTIRERTTSLIQFLVRLAGIIGGVLGKRLSSSRALVVEVLTPSFFV